MTKTLKQPLIRLRLARPLLHGGILIGLFFLTYKLRLITDLIPWTQLRIPTIYTNELLIFAVCATSLFIILWAVGGLYDLFKPTPNYSSLFFKVYGSRFIGISFLSYYGSGYLFEHGISRLIIIRVGLFGLLAYRIIDSFYQWLIQHLERKKGIQTIVCGKTPEEITTFIEHIGSETLYHFHPLTHTKNLHLDASTYDFFVAVGSFTKDELQLLFDAVRLQWKRFYHVSESFFLEDVLYESEELGPVIAFEYKASTLDGRSVVIKRFCDIMGSLAFMALFCRLYLAIALYIRLKDGGPVIYASRRTGKNGQGFRMYKFRTMVKNAEALKSQLAVQNERKWPLFKLTDDPRVPKRGRILRKLSLDELPQFFNVLMGAMSLVGPRPHLPSEIANYEHRQRRLLSIKPGITGYAQVFGRDALDFDQEAQLDLYYIQHRNVLLDAWIVLRTLRVVTKGR